MKNTIQKLALAGLLSTSLALNSQSDSSRVDSSKNERLFQLSVIHPIGSNGIDGAKMVNNVSINLIGGHSAGVKGLELSGFANTTNGNIDGAQLSGFANVVKGDINGIQGTGFSNVSIGHTHGVQVSGFSNYAHKDFDGIQATGFSNMNKGNFKGLQAAGFSNVNKGSFEGIQASGFQNTNLDSLHGAQFSGFSNVNKGSLKGIQGAGFTNVTLGDLDGIQAAGFVNRAETVRGFQLGFINVANKYETGLPIGFISYIKEGYHHFELESSLEMNAVLSFKTGVDKFYNILSIGAHFENGEIPSGSDISANKLAYAAGYGVGTNVVLGQKSSINFDLTAYQLFEASQRNLDLNHLSRFKINYSYKFLGNLAVYGGPTLNFRAYDSANSSLLTAIPENTIHTYTDNDWTTNLYLGANIGLRL